MGSSSRTNAPANKHNANNPIESIIFHMEMHLKDDPFSSQLCLSIVA